MRGAGDEPRQAASRPRTVAALAARSGRGRGFYVDPALVREARRTGRLDLSAKRNLVMMPHEVFTIRNLRTLELQRTGLVSLPRELAALTSLQTLRLDHNAFASVPEVLFAMENLRTLFLHSNNITSIDSRIGQMKGLEVLSLSGNCLEIIPLELGALPRLFQLSLHDMQIPLLSPPKEIAHVLLQDGSNASIYYLRELLQVRDAKRINVSAIGLERVPLDITGEASASLLARAGARKRRAEEAQLELSAERARLQALADNMSATRKHSMQRQSNETSRMIGIRTGVESLRRALDDIATELRECELLIRDAKQAQINFNVAQLVANKNKITCIEKSIINLSNLERLSLRDNRITELPSELPPSLAMLDLGGNSLPRFPPCILSLKRLQGLWLDRNQLQEIPNEITALHTLEILSVAATGIEALPGPVGRLRRLRSLDASRNALRALPAAAAALRSLVELDLSMNEFERIPHEITALQTLQILRMNGNRVREVPAGSLSPCSSLRELWLEDNLIRSVEENFSGCSRLEALSLANNDTVLLSVDFAARCPLLQVLLLDGNDALVYPPLSVARQNARTCLDFIAKVAEALRSLVLDVRGFALGEFPRLSAHTASWSTIRVLNISENCLHDLSTVYEELPGLEELRADRNKIRFVTSGILHLTNLVLLSLRENELDTISPALGGHQQLRTLDIRNNLSLRSPPRSVADKDDDTALQYLRQLHVARQHDTNHVALTSLGLAALPPILSHYTALKTIDLTNNALASIPPQITLHPSLETLILQRNSISFWCREMIRLVNLRILDLESNKITTIPDYLARIATLEELYLHHNLINDVPVTLFGLSRLKILTLSSNRLSVLPADVKRLDNLEELWIFDNPDLDFLCKEVYTLKNLRILLTDKRHKGTQIAAFTIREEENEEGKGVK